MKKYFLGLIALVVGLGLSAFTLPVKKEVKAVGTPYIWYAVVDNEVDPGSPINEGEPWDIDQFYTETGALCPDGNVVECVRGFLSNNLPTVGDEAYDEHLMKED